MSGIREPGRAIASSLAERFSEWLIARMRVRPLSRRVASRLGERLVGRGRFEDADAVLEAALAAWPKRSGLLQVHALSAHVSGRYQIALERWQLVRAADMENVAAWCGISACARMLNDLKTARATIHEALQRFSDQPAVMNEAAYVLEQSGRFREAADQWRRLVELEPAHPLWLQGYAFNLITIGRFDEAEAILERAAVSHPDDQALLATRAMLASEREDWNAALALWRVYRERYPDDMAGWEGQGKTIAAIHAARAEAAFDAPAEVAKVEIDTVEDDALRSLMLGFESLGADCEFGLVQRRFGAEPLGLLRFNDVGLASLSAGLAACFEGMGEPENTSLVVSQSGEFYVSDRRWSLGMHTFMFASRHEAAALLPKMCRRVAYLRDKLLDDLRAAEKVFVFKSDALDLDGLRALHDALRAYGPIRLLHVRRASVPLADRPFDVLPGKVYELDDDLFVGFLSRMGSASSHWDIAFDEWIAICRGLESAVPRLA